MSTHRHLAVRIIVLLLALALAVSMSPAAAHGTASGGGGSPGRGSGAALGEVPMHARSDVYGPGIWHHADEGRTWYGAYRTFDDVFAYCIDAGKQSPLPEHFTDSAPKRITSPRTAWALHEHSGSTSADVHAALSAMARLDKAIPHDHTVPPQAPGDLGKEFAASAKQYSAITADAKRFAGPYELKVTLERIPTMPVLEPYDTEERPRGAAQDPDQRPAQEPDQRSAQNPDERAKQETDGRFASRADGPDDGGSGDGSTLALPSDRVEITVSLLSAAGHHVPDVPVDLEIGGIKDGPTSLTSGSEPVTRRADVAAPGRVTVKASAEVASASVLLYSPKRAKGVQRVVTADEPAKVTARSSLDMKSQPMVTTEISDQTPRPGDSLTDSFTVSGLIGGHTVDVVHELWQTASRPEPGKKNDDARRIGSVTSKGVDNGTHRSPAIEVPDDFSGWLYFTETIAADAKTREWKGIHGQPRETGFVPWSPLAETTAVLEGTRAHDDVVVSGLRPGAEATITVTAYHSDTQPTRSREVQGTELDSQDLTVTADSQGRAELSTKEITVPVGWTTFVVSIHEDEVHRPWTSEWGIPAETVHRPADEPPNEPTAPPTPSEEPSPSEAPTPPEEPTPSESPKPSAPPAPPADERPAAEPEPRTAEPSVAPAADVPDQLPRTGTTGNGVLVGAGILLIGLGTCALLITGRRDPRD
ncbi:LPXTG-motif cell wall-anchored protein [Brevibacterium sanguinis]|uniref:LPXTG-motif cell wall-anchored protein n=2 Tax=Brevibacterium TaxID=1696 RepID=A0A366IGD7_9MICO|nr:MULTISPECIES: LPXTG cell wall anchor domain-containing protein [Brevibacterium]RBP62747.1 LPXTG-motif cell wall-anchored protein [Brevibacterium sanguinis]RBP69312.1 LPXTG-motif cell wall-anchored protein [Brevibacterium celere]